MSSQTESLHYYAKRRCALPALWSSFVAGAALREIARRYGLSAMSVQGALLRLGRQAMAAQVHLLAALQPQPAVCFDGLRSCVSSADYPCDITAVAETAGETILTMVHSITARGGTMRPAQRRRLTAKLARWRPAPGATKAAISLLVTELWDYLRPSPAGAATIDTDEHPLYRALLSRHPVGAHLRTAGLLSHRRTPSAAPRTRANRLFALNYLDRLLRHRVKEHTRESIAIGREATLQMHRAWIFAWDHNANRSWRVRRPAAGVHAEQAAVAPAVRRELTAGFFTRRIRLSQTPVPESIRTVWAGELPTPPLRWRAGQSGSTVRVPRWALRDLAQAYQQAA
jgi:hypothetical protein